MRGTGLWDWVAPVVFELYALKGLDGLSDFQESRSQVCGGNAPLASLQGLLERSCCEAQRGSPLDVTEPNDALLGHCVDVELFGNLLVRDSLMCIGKESYELGPSPIVDCALTIPPLWDASPVPMWFC